MKIKGILFDVNGTLINIHTDENMEEIYRAVGRFLAYQGIYVSGQEVKEHYFRIMDEQKKSSGEKFPEFDAVAVWRELLSRNGNSAWILPPDKLQAMARFLAEMYRSISLQRLELYPDVMFVLDDLRSRFRLAVVTDAQSVWALPEMRTAGIDGYFDSVVVSGEHGFRKPDPRLFQVALDALDAAPEEVLFVGNDMYHDVYGAGKMGMKTVFFASNQGRQQMEGVEPDYIIYCFAELREAVKFFERRK